MAKRKIEYRVNDKPISAEQGKPLVLAWSQRHRDQQEREAQVRALARRPVRGEADSVRFAMRCIEQRIVRGLWVLELSQEPDGPREQRRHGMQYMRDHGDVDWRYEDAPGGKWDAPAPRPALPSNEEIDAAKEAQGWIRWLDDEQARFFTLAAMSKRGDRSRRINWERVFGRMKHLRDTKMRTLQDRYDQALRRIVAEMTVDRMSA